MILFFSGLLVLGVMLSAYNWFYLREVETANMRIGLTLPKEAMMLFKGVFFACLFASVTVVFTVFASLLTS
jgi:hypothetical protein